MRASSACRRVDSGGRRSCVPRGAVMFVDMNPLLIVVAVVALLALVPIATAHAALSTAAATLFEGMPLILASRLAERAFRTRAAMLVALAGCGCGGAPAALSFAGLVAAWWTFGPLTAVLRLGGGISAWLLLRRSAHPAGHGDSLLTSLNALLPCAVLGGLAANVLPSLGGLARAAPWEQFALGAALGATAAPCGLGAIAVAAALHATMPPAGFGVLCTAGIADARLLLHRDRQCGEHRFGYAIAAAACALVAAHGGDALVNPRWCAALWVCCAACAWRAVRMRAAGAPAALTAPAAMLVAALAGTPLPPEPIATATTLSGAYAGERVDFTGRLTHRPDGDALVRYAITCCRADAAPVIVRLDRRAAFAPGTWLHARGSLVDRAGDLRLASGSLDAISAPGDPFVYR